MDDVYRQLGRVIGKAITKKQDLPALAMFEYMQNAVKEAGSVKDVDWDKTIKDCHKIWEANK